MSDPSILVVDDEPQIRRALRVVLTGHGYDVRLADSGEQALDMASVALPNVVILDLAMPGLSGLDVCRELRGWTEVPIIVLSAKDQERDKVEALDLGADDYLTKPFGTDELLARIRAALRRTSSAPPSSVLESGDLRLDQTHRVVTLGDRELRLTPREYDVLRHLMANAGKVLTHRTLLHAIWGDGYEDGGAILRGLILQLRRKLEADPSRPRYIRTEAGIGYRFQADP